MNTQKENSEKQASPTHMHTPGQESTLEALPACQLLQPKSICSMSHPESWPSLSFNVSDLKMSCSIIYICVEGILLVQMQ